MSRTNPSASVAAALCASTLIACGPGKIDVNGPPPTSVPIRRLTNAEYTATVADLFPGYTLPELSFVPDAKVLGFLNLSSSQTGSLVRMEQYEAAAFAIAQTVTADPTTLTGCDAAAQGEASCVGPYLADFGKRAYRRPLTGAEQDGLLALLARDEGHASTTRRGSRWWCRRCCCRRSSCSAPEIGDRSQAGRAGRSADVVGDGGAAVVLPDRDRFPTPELAAAADGDKLRRPTSWSSRRGGC